MAKIICVTSGLRGILNASFELMNRLGNDGHEVVYAAPRNIGVEVEKQGIRFIQLPEISFNFDEDIPSFQGPFRKVKRWLYKLNNASVRKAKALDQFYPKAFDDLLDSFKADLLLIDVELHEYIFRAYAKRIPFLLLSQWFSLWNRSGLPYLLTDTIPGEGWRGKKWMMFFSWQWIKVKRWYIFTKKRLLTFGTDRRSILLALAKTEKFPLQYIRENYWPGPFTYDQLPVMSMVAREMEFPHDKRPNHFYVGPLVEPNRKESFSDDVRLAIAFQYRERKQAALIYCSLSTLSKSDPSFIKKVIEAVRDQKQWMLVVGMGGLLAKDDFENLPENVFLFSYVPQLKILSEADCSINHGGIHTINECIHFKVPMLVYSGKKSDQNGCAARVAYHQLGMMGDKDHDTAKEIKNKIGKVLTDPIYKKKIEKMYAHSRKYKNDAVVERLMNEFLMKNKKTRTK